MSTKHNARTPNGSGLIALKAAAKIRKSSDTPRERHSPTYESARVIQESCGPLAAGLAGLWRRLLRGINYHPKQLIIF
jgi:hypothetical protein